MTEHDWLTSKNPKKMLMLLRESGRTSNTRKLRMWVEACRTALMAAESALIIWRDLDKHPEALEGFVETWLSSKQYNRNLPLAARADLLRDIFGNPFRTVRLPMVVERKTCEECGGKGFKPNRFFPSEESVCGCNPWGVRDNSRIKGKTWVGEYCPWLLWNRGAIPALAQQMYDSRDFSLIPILGDMLEDAGCTESEILNHCRGLTRHAVGCWVIDLILGLD